LGGACLFSATPAGSLTGQTSTMKSSVMSRLEDCQRWGMCFGGGPVVCFWRTFSSPPHFLSPLLGKI